MVRMRTAIGFLLAASVFVIQTLLVPGTGMTWDEPASWFIGRANIKFWTTGDRRYIEDVRNKALFKDDPIKFIYGEELYPPFTFVVQSAFSYVLAERLPILSTIDAHHVGEVAIGALGVWAFFLLACEIGLSLPVALVTSIIYTTYPTILGEMRSDAKDVPLMSLLVVAVYFFVLFMKSWASKRHLHHVALGVAASIVLGVAQASKPTAVILLPIVLLWFIFVFITSKSFRRTIQPVRRLIVFTPFLLLIAAATWILLWPWLWTDITGRLMMVWGFFKVVGYQLPVQYFGEIYRAGMDVPWHYPFAILGVQTPLEILFLGVVGTLVVIWNYGKHKNAYGLLPLFWFFLAIGRFMIPGIIIYAKVRHFIDAMPAFFLLVGWGIEGLIQVSGVKFQVSGKKKIQKIVLVGLAVLTIGHQAWITVRLYPYEPVYFNVLVGGIQGVATKDLFDAEYWASGVKEAMEAIKNDPSTIKRNEKGERTVVNACFLRHLAYFYKTPQMDLPLEASVAHFTIIPNSASLYKYPISYHKANNRLIYTVKRDGADLYYVFEHLNPWGWYCGMETEMTYE